VDYGESEIGTGRADGILCELQDSKVNKKLPQIPPLIAKN
jgi:hypothetical protein